MNINLEIITLPSPDYRELPTHHKWAGIIIHHTSPMEASLEENNYLWEKMKTSVLKWLTLKDNNYLSSHFFIDRAGEIVCMVDPEKAIAFHAGNSTLWNPITREITYSCNSFCIGIELLGNGNVQDFSEPQYISLGKLCKELMRIFPDIQPHCITGHEVVSPRRKVDPGKFFNWRKLFSLIYDNQ